MYITFSPPQAYFADVFLYTEPALFGNIANYENLIKDNTIEDVVYTKVKGAFIGSELVSGNRVGSLIIRAENPQELQRKIASAIAGIEVYDVFGKPILRRDLY